jgi:hypothetical protein
MVDAALWVEMNGAARRHGGVARLEERPFAIGDARLAIIDCLAKHRRGQADFSRS